MPSQISNDKIENFLTRNTIPVPLSSLPEECVNCPICNTAYSERDLSNVHPLITPDAPEYPVQVVHCGSCSHILGRVCIEKSIRAGQPWSHICPLCRAEWFVAPHSTRTEMLACARRGLDILAGVFRDESTRDMLGEVERQLELIEDRLLERRWI